MAGTISGGKQASKTNKERHGEDFYARIGAIGGSHSKTGGFASSFKCDGMCDLDSMFGLDHKKAQCAGYLGGKKSRRKPM